MWIGRRASLGSSAETDSLSGGTCHLRHQKIVLFLNFLWIVWMLSIIWDRAASRGRNKAVRSCKSAGIVMDNQKTQAVIYWSGIYNEAGSAPASSLVIFWWIRGDSIPCWWEEHPEQATGRGNTPGLQSQWDPILFTLWLLLLCSWPACSN